MRIVAPLSSIQTPNVCMSRARLAHFEAKVGGAVEYQTTTMDIADYLTQGGQTAGHRELWRLLRSLFNENSDSAEYTDETSPAAG